MGKIKNYLISLKKGVSCLAFFAIPLGATLFIYSNSLETIFQEDFLPTNAINHFAEKSDYLADFDTRDLTPNLNGNPVGDYGKPLVLSIPKINRRLEIVPAITSYNTLLNRPNNAHFLTLTEENSVKIVALYLTQSWRTIPNPEAIQPGTNLYIDTNRAWRYVFEVEEVLKINLDTYFAPKLDTTQLLLIIKDHNQADIFLARAIYRTVLSI